MPVGVISMPPSTRTERLPLLPGDNPLDAMRCPIVTISARRFGVALTTAARFDKTRATRRRTAVRFTAPAPERASGAPRALPERLRVR